jgi:hypothetical protein
MAAWDRHTPWRQGHALTSEAVLTLGLIQERDAPNAIVIVISHDCDIAQSGEVEPCVEIIIGCRVPEANGNLTHAKNPRRLHLPAQENGNTVCLELWAKDKCLVPNDRLVAHLPNESITLTSHDRSVLQRWLAARYRRSAFADEFERRLQETGLHKRIAKILEPLGTHLIAVFFDVDEGADVERHGAEDLYMLTIELLYSTEHDPMAALKAAENAAEAISVAFRERCFVSKDAAWKQIELLACEPISDEAMTYAMSMQLKKWNADYLSLRADPATEPMLSE